MANDALLSGDSKLDSIIESFESAYVAGKTPRIEDHLPDRADPDFQEIFLELLRVDMEHRWASGIPKRFAEYLRQFEDDLKNSTLATQLAFEEYRLHIDSGESISKAYYQSFSNVSVEDWPKDAQPPIENADTMSVDRVSTDFDSLPEAITHFPDLGDRVAGFRLLKQIGRGKFGRVFLAEQNSLSARLVVLKITTLKSIEPQRLAQLQHTNVVPIHSAHQIDNLQIVCMPYFGETTLVDVVSEARKTNLKNADGGVIQAALQQNSIDRIDDKTTESSSFQFCQQTYVNAIIGLAVQIAEALAHAHARGVLHRDLKPANILLADDGRPLLLDFNLSEQIIPGGMASLLVGGTVPYMSPEQIRSLEVPETVDQRSDIFSFGVVLFELLTGKRPFSDHAQGTSLSALLKERSDRRAACKLNRQIPKSISDLIAQCMESDADARYSRFEQILTDLNRHLENRPLVHTANRSPLERVSKWVQRNPKLLSGTSIALLSCLLLLSVVVGSFLIQHHARKTIALETIRTVADSLPNIRVEIGSTDTSLDAIHTGKEALRDAYDKLNIDQIDADDSMKNLVRGDASSQLDSVRRETLFLLSHANERLARHTVTEDDRRELLEESLEYNRQSFQIPDHENDEIQFKRQAQDLHAMLHHTEDHHRIDMDASAENGTGSFAVLNLLRQGRYDDAVPILERLREANPLEFSTWFHLGESYFADGRISDANACFSTCIVIWPNSPKALLFRGICHLSSLEFAKAKNDFDGALALRQSWSAALFNRAVAHRGLKKYSAAESDLSEIVNRGQATPRVLFLRATIRKQLRDAKGASDDLHQAMQLSPNDYRDFISRGMSRIHSNPDLALQDFADAVRLNPASRKALRNTIYVLSEKRNDTNAALAVAEKMIERLGKTPDDLMSVAVLNARLGHFGQAEENLKRALSMREDGKLCFQAACVYALADGKKSTELAIAQLRKAVQLDTNWLSELSDPDLVSLRSHKGFRELNALAVAYKKTVEN